MSLESSVEPGSRLAAPQIQPSVWPVGRWLSIILIVFALQLGLIFGLTDRTPLVARTFAQGPTLRISGAGSAELLALSDPTLFALPHHQAFSGLAWMTPPPLPARSFSWSEEPSWLSLGVQELGAAFKQFVATNHFELVQTLMPPNPVSTLSAGQAAITTFTSSVLRIEGALAQRRLLTAVNLPSRAHPDLLTNTVVQLVVEEEGRPFSATTLSSSGQAAADIYALDLAWTLRFNSIKTESKPPGSLPGLTWGKLIFEWSTVPTNAPANVKP